MTRIFFPGCKIKAKYPQASKRMAELVMERGYADEVTGCCRIKHQGLTADDTAVCICNNCMAMIDEDAANETMDNIWVLIDNDPGFPLPSYEGRTMSVQDCGRAYDRAEVHAAVRSLLAKMGVKIVEQYDAGEKSVFCGMSFLAEAPAQEARFAPWRYIEDAAKRGIYAAHEPDDAECIIKEHASKLPCDTVACYCTACDAGLAAGGKQPVNLIELVTGCFIER